MQSENSNCRVCGYPLRSAPWGNESGSATYEFCPCCGVEFGYQDVLPVAAQRFRTEWLRAGAEWSEPHMRPMGWDLHKQLEDIPAPYG